MSFEKSSEKSSEKSHEESHEESHEKSDKESSEASPREPHEQTLESSRDRAAMLFCPPLPPLRLGHKLPIFIGRHPSCELAIRCDDVSRRHAEVRCENGSFVVYDLESTNGTFVNGAKLEGSHRLMPGDRVEVGSNTITFCEIDAGATPSPAAEDNEHTIIFERPPDTKLSFGGELSEVPAAAIFQLLEMGSNSGLLELSSTDGAASVWFEMANCSGSGCRPSFSAISRYDCLMFKQSPLRMSCPAFCHYRSPARQFT